MLTKIINKKLPYKKKVHIYETFFIYHIFSFFICTFAIPQNRKIEVKTKTQKSMSSNVNMNAPELVFNVGHSGDVYFVSCSLDGKYLASGSADGTIRFWDIATGELLAITFNLKDGELQECLILNIFKE